MGKIKRIYNKVNEYCPLPSFILYGVCIIAIIIHIISIFNEAFADFFNQYISSAIRATLAHITNIFPFSFAETVLMFLPVIIIVLFLYCIKLSKNSVKFIVRYLCTLLSVATLMYSIFVCGFAVAYQGSTLEKKLGFDRKPVSVQALYDTTKILLDKANALADEVNYIYGSFSIMPYSFGEMNEKLNESYITIHQKYPFIQKLHSNVKPIILSVPMTYTHISGVYTYYTGEANLNMNFPDYTLPFTAAHELAHQRGIAREDEANFMAFLVCMENDDPYIRYSAYLNMYEYVSSALYNANQDYYFTLLETMDNKIRYELIAYNDFFDKYRDSVVSNVSDKMNDTFLKSQGQTEGSKSYGRVVDLTVAYYVDLEVN